MLKAALREFTLVHAMSAARRQMAADLWTKLMGLNHKDPTSSPVWVAALSHPVGCQLTTLTIAILLLLSPKADTHFTIPRRVEG